MPTVRYFDRQITSAVVLGVAALVTNLLSYLLLLDHSLPAGNIFLFCSAGALGVPGALASAAIGVIPDTLFSGEHLYGLRVLSLCVALGFVGTRFPRVPSFAVALGLWVFCYAPALHFLNGLHRLPEHLDGASITFDAVSEILFAMIAGALLLNTEIWGAITHRPRHVALSSLLVHFFTIVSTVGTLGALSIRFGGGWSFESAAMDASPRTIISMLFLCIALPSYIGWRLARRLATNSQELLGLQKLANGSAMTFSGLASDYWRRQAGGEVDTSRKTQVIEAKHGPDSSGKLDLPKGEKAKNVRPDQGICALNRNGTITFMNRRFKAYTDISTNDVLGKSIEAIGMNPAVCKHVVDLIEMTFQRGPRVTEIKLNQLPDKLRYFEIASLKPEDMEESSLNDGPDSVIITMRDITDRRAIESHLLQSQKLSSLGNLVRNIAHSFNNTLTAIVGLASYARVSNDPQKVATSLDKILASSKLAGDLVRNLLDFTSDSPSHIKVEDLTNVLASRLELLKKIAGEKYEISFKSPERPLGIECDANLIMQAITNVVVNSRDSYQDRSGTIEIALDTETLDEDVTDLHVGARPGEFARLRIKDKGAGMTAETLSKAFDPLFTTKSATGNTGLGLSIVHAIVRAHDGFLTVETYPEKGTTVSLYFPLRAIPERVLVPVKEREDLRETLPGAVRNGHQEKILVVEDEQGVRELVASMLSLLGYEVTSCGDGQEALVHCQQDKFDLVLVDMIMPRMHGLDLVEKIKSADETVRALVMTGYGVTVEPRSEPCTILPKPFDLNTLAHAVRDALHPEKIPTPPAPATHPKRQTHSSEL